MTAAGPSWVDSSTFHTWPEPAGAVADQLGPGILQAPFPHPLTVRKLRQLVVPPRRGRTAAVQHSRKGFPALSGRHVPKKNILAKDAVAIVTSIQGTCFSSVK